MLTPIWIDEKPGTPAPPEGHSYADLHLHTQGSDGLLHAEEWIDAARDGAIRVIAVTDHDHIETVREWKLRDPEGTRHVIPGVELTARGRIVHLGVLFTRRGSLRRCRDRGRRCSISSAGRAASRGASSSWSIRCPGCGGVNCAGWRARDCCRTRSRRASPSAAIAAATIERAAARVRARRSGRQRRASDPGPDRRSRHALPRRDGRGSSRRAARAPHARRHVAAPGPRAQAGVRHAIALFVAAAGARDSGCARDPVVLVAAGQEGESGGASRRRGGSAQGVG